jgi:hypothetical protein
VVATCLAPPIDAAGQPPEASALPAASRGSTTGGELALVGIDGALSARIGNLGAPISLTRLDGGWYLVVDKDHRRIVELDLDGRTRWEWRYHHGRPRPVSAYQLPNGHILFAAGHRGAVEIDRSGAAVWRAPGLGLFVASAVRLPDGDTLLAIRHSAHSLFVVGPDGRDPVELAPPGAGGHGHWTQAAPAVSDGSELWIWDPDWPDAHRVTVRDRRLDVLESVPVWRAVHLTQTPTGGLAWGGDLDLALRLRAPDETVRQLELPFPITGIAPGPGPGELAITYQRIPDASWPESRPLRDGPHPASARQLAPWLAAGLLVVAALQALAWQRPRGAPVLGGPPSRLEPAPRPIPWPAVVVAIVSAAGGLVLVRHGMQQLRSDLASGWLVPVVGGAVGCALILESWRRLVLRRPDPFWAAATAARPHLEAPVAIAVGAAVVVAGSAVLGWWRAVSAEASAQLGLWIMLLLVTLGMAFLSEPRPRQWNLSVDWRFWAAMAIPVAVASFTMLHRLRDIPAFLHFDHVYYATSALDLLEGRFRSPWDFGFVPGPLVGLVAPAAGLALAGPGQVGFRLGSALLGISGVAAVGILGRCYRDRRTGVIAALLLAGSIPYVHFSRTGANGDAATISLWTLTTFALALRTGRQRWWLLTGALAGLCLYLWPGARVAVLACCVAGFLLAVRSPRAAARRWFGPPLAILALAVWVAPLVPTWVADPATLAPRAEVSLEVFKPSTGFNWPAFSDAFGEPLARSLGWFFVLPDNSTHGTVTPGCNELEATLLAVGIVLVLIEGFSINLLLAAQLAGVLLFLGAFGDGPPWYTRLVPSMPIAVLLMARTAVGTLDLLATRARSVRALALAAAVAGLLLLSPVANLARYVEAEDTGVGTLPQHAMTSVGRRLHELGPSYHHYLVTTGSLEWSCDAERANGYFGVLLPYIWDLHVSELRDLPSRLPLPAGEAASLVLQSGRAEADLAAIRRWYPDAEMEELHDRHGARLAAVVVLEQRVVDAAARPIP